VKLPPLAALQAPQRALRDLDAYRTPIVPSRLRESSVDPAVDPAVAPDLPRPDGMTRESTPVIMEDAIEMDSSYSRLGSGTPPTITNGKPKAKPSHPGQEQTGKNQGKPYAGEGGLRRLLMRRREELYEEEEQQKLKNEPREARETREASVSTDTDFEMTPSSQNLMSSLPVPPTSTVPQVQTRPLSPSLKPPDHSSSSSLRIGRARTARTHMRPTTRPNKVKFSAAYEDEEGGTGTANENATRECEMKELHEAAKHVPVFNIPADFSFAKDVRPFHSNCA
jgi:nucleoporin NUP1